jgi:hypothetical protein
MSPMPVSISIVPQKEAEGGKVKHPAAPYRGERFVYEVNGGLETAAWKIRCWQRRNGLPDSATATRMDKTVSVPHSTTAYNPVVDGCFLEPKVGTQPEVRDLALFHQPINGARVAPQVTSQHIDCQYFIVHRDLNVFFHTNRR